MIRTLSALLGSLCLLQCGKPTTFTADPCPETGRCRWEIHPNTRLQIHTDDTGAHYYQLLPQDGQSVYQYTYERPQNDSLADDQHLETLLLQLPDQAQKQTWTNDQLRELNALFELQAYQKGRAGVYPLQKGHAALRTLKGRRHIQLSLNDPALPASMQNFYYREP